MKRVLQLLLILIVCFTALAIIGMIADESDPPKTAQTSLRSDNAPSSLEPPAEDETAPISPSNARGHDVAAVLEQLVRDQFGEKLKSVEVRRLSLDVNGDLVLDEAMRAWAVDVQFRAESNLTNRLTKRSIERDMMDYFHNIFTSEMPIRMAIIEAYMILMDQFGNEEENIVYGTTIWNNSASKMNWRNRHLINPGDVWEVHFMNNAFRIEAR